MKRLLITVDGPSGAGKTTVSRLLAQRLGYRYIDTGALYRGVALAVSRKKWAAVDDSKLADICSKLTFQFRETPNGQRLYMNGIDITEQIRTPEISMLASDISARRCVRQFLLKVQKKMAKDGAVVVEGRDIGTVVFPNADMKFYLDADHDTRVLRRYKELAARMGRTHIRLDEVAKAVTERDERDSSRSLAPLKPARDAIRIDSTLMEIEEVVDLMQRYIAGIVK
ncbi:MAG: (d)CMP kinase [Deltaproteobacteria bacterium]|nr:(d)CMP kinase [Deltaproteobacteria bacterium]